jgi:hypothetical protein
VKTWVSYGFLSCICLCASGLPAVAQVSSLLPSDATIKPAVPATPTRNLAVTVVQPDQNSEDTALGPFDLDFLKDHPELEWSAPDFPDAKPHFASPSETLVSLSRDVIFRHEVWSLEFSFKPARLIEVNLPTSDGGMVRKVVWYVLYKVRYAGKDAQPNLDVEDKTAEVPSTPKSVRFDSVRFIPRFEIVSKERNFRQDSQILPQAKAAVAARERVGKPIYDEVEISKIEIPYVELDPNGGTWGVATWTDVDPRLDFFAVDIRGLTNAYKIRIDAEGKKNFDRKTLRLYFWRPGDVLDVAQDRILLGLPALENKERLDYYLRQFNLKERLDYQWIYR